MADAPGSDLLISGCFMENTIKTIQIEARGYQDGPKTEKFNGTRPFWEPRGGPGGGPGPRATPFWTPSFSTTLPTHPTVFGVFPGLPPGTPLKRKYTYFQRFLMICRRIGVRKGAPWAPPLHFARLPRGPRDPQSCCFFPPRPPKGTQGGPKGTQEGGFRGYGPPVQVSHLKTMFCHTSPAKRHHFCPMLL